MSALLVALAAGGGVCRAAEGVAGVQGVHLSLVRQRAAAQGFVVREIRWDPVLQRAWAILESREHPEQPQRAVLTELTANEAGMGSGSARTNVAAMAAPPVVHAGDRVMVRSVEKNLRMQVVAVAEENGRVGDRVRMRLPGAGGDQGAWRMAGIVSGPGEVEMEP